MLRALTVPLVAAALFAAGCSDDPSTDAAPTSTTTAVPTTTAAPTTVAPPPEAAPEVYETELIEIAVDDFVFVARTAGPEDGDAVFLLHGFPNTSAMWQNQIDALAAAGYRVIAPDQRGYSPGARPIGVEHYAIDLIAGDVVGMVDSLGIDRFHVVGHDFGGAAAWAVADLFSDRVISMGAVSTPHPAALTDTIASEESDQASRSSYVDAFVREGSEIIFTANDGAALRGVMADAGLSEEEAAIQVDVLNDADTMIAALNWYRASFNSDGFAVGEIDLPTLFIWSTGDDFLGPDPAWATGARVSGGFQFEVIHGVNHWVPEVAADIVNEVLLEFLSEGAVSGEQQTTLNAMGGASYCELRVPAGAEFGVSDRYRILTSLGVDRCGDSAERGGELRHTTADEISFSGPVGLEHVEGRNYRVESELLAVARTDPNASYEPQQVERSDRREWSAAREVYELLDPDGTRWTMISFTPESFGFEGPASLVDLPERMTVPDGWDYIVRMLEEPLVLVADEMTYELRDSIGNTYQLNDSE